MSVSSSSAEALRQTRMREFDEWIEQASESFGLGSGLRTFRCECGDRGCAHAIDLTRPEYESVRAEPIRFAIELNHENPETDCVVAEYERYAVVEKLVGEIARQARRSSRR